MSNYNIEFKNGSRIDLENTTIDFDWNMDNRTTTNGFVTPQQREYTFDVSFTPVARFGHLAEADDDMRPMKSSDSKKAVTYECQMVDCEFETDLELTDPPKELWGYCEECEKDRFLSKRS